ncbi:MAG: hypothetical protein II671_00085 [Salinivirgaceae bacterium]|nr:hypothetical protein [Salinivirgaceae bacterium]
MTPTTINVQVTKCPKQYETVRLGMECTIAPEESAEDAIKAAHNELLAMYADMYPPKQAKPKEPQPEPQPEQKPEPKPDTDGKKLVKFGDKELQQIIARIEKAPEKGEETVSKARQFFTFDDEAERVLNLAITLNK